MKLVKTCRQKYTLSRIYKSKEMVQEITNCTLEPITSDIKRITLPHNQVVYVGRSMQTLVYNKDVSRKQLALKANYDKEIVECVEHGINPSGCNGYALKRDVMYSFKHGDRLELLIGNYIYEIHFYPASSDEEGPSKKMKVDDESVQKPAALPSEVKGSWQFIENSLLIFTPNMQISGNRVASFDMDGTLIKTKSGQRFPKDNSDWELIFGNIREKLKEAYFKGYRIVIFSNQLKLGQEPQKISGFKAKIENIVNKLGVPVQVFLATKKDVYRKPTPGMWDAFLTVCDEKIRIEDSFYVGDAAGRKDKWAPHKKKDHSIADRLFAINLKLNFYTPEEYFLGAKVVPFQMPEFDPREVTSVDQNLPLSGQHEVILLVGCQGSGKTHFYKTALEELGYTHISRDVQQKKEACLKLLQWCLQNKKSAVIDNTNPTVQAREPYVQLCQKYGVSCKCFIMDVPHKQCLHNNKFRTLTDSSHSVVADIIINSYRKSYQEPTMDEGYSNIYKFKFNTNFRKESDEKLYKMFLLES